MATPQQEYERIRAQGLSHKQVMKRMSRKNRALVRAADIRQAQPGFEGVGWVAGKKGEETGRAVDFGTRTVMAEAGDTPGKIADRYDVNAIQAQALNDEDPIAGSTWVIPADSRKEAGLPSGYFDTPTELEVDARLGRAKRAKGDRVREPAPPAPEIIDITEKPISEITSAGAYDPYRPATAFYDPSQPISPGAPPMEKRAPKQELVKGFPEKGAGAQLPSKPSVYESPEMYKGDYGQIRLEIALRDWETKVTQFYVSDFDRIGGIAGWQDDRTAGGTIPIEEAFSDIELAYLVVQGIIEPLDLGPFADPSVYAGGGRAPSRGAPPPKTKRTVGTGGFGGARPSDQRDFASISMTSWSGM